MQQTSWKPNKKKINFLSIKYQKKKKFITHPKMLIFNCTAYKTQIVHRIIINKFVHLWPPAFKRKEMQNDKIYYFFD